MLEIFAALIGIDAGRDLAKHPYMRTTLGICTRKARYATEEEAWAVAHRADIVLRRYRCALCRQYHLTSRTKGMRLRPPYRE
ncbi:hypothetical protein [Sphingobium yanoikuyae]|uniref:hypothetical protein n=1 Tax=Sphingobium yanoikuyae TaxID=13690 RepID=UPI003F68C272